MTRRRSARGTSTGNDASRKPLAELQPDPANARLHPTRNLEMMTAARSSGRRPPRAAVIDERDQILAGSGIAAAAGAAGITRVRIIEAEGDELIAVRRRNLSPVQKQQLAIYDNRAAELAEWNPDQLAADHSSGFDLAPFFRVDELAKLLPNFAAASEAEQGQLDRVQQVTCPNCGHVFDRS
jgi:hypothetical protein